MDNGGKNLSGRNITDPKLARSLNTFLLTMYGVGVTIGAGIYVLVGVTAEKAGLFAPISFLVAAGVVGFTAFSYAELTTRFPMSGGEAVFVREGFGSEKFALFIGLLIIASGVVSSATISIGAASYLQNFITASSSGLIAGICLVLGLIAIWGILESVWIVALFTLVEVGGLVFVVAYGLATTPAIVNDFWRLIPPFDMGIWSGIGAGGLMAFFAFIGFEDMANVAEEVKSPKKTLPKAIIATLSITTIIYFAVVSVIVLVVPMQELVTSTAPLSLVFKQSDLVKKAFSLIAIVATLNGVLVQIIMASRVLFGVSKQNKILSVFARINPVTRTPIYATVAVVVLILVLAIMFPIAGLARSTSMVVLAVFVVVNAALLLIKQKTKQEAAEFFTVPIWVPAMGLLTSLALLATVLI